METEGGEEILDVDQSEGGLSGQNKILNVKNKTKQNKKIKKRISSCHLIIKTLSLWNKQRILRGIREKAK